MESDAAPQCEAHSVEMEETSASFRAKSAITTLDVSQEYGYKYEYTENDHDDILDEERVCSTSVQGLSLTAPNPTATTAENILGQPDLEHVYILGKTYHAVNDYALRRDDESSLFWITYRCDFPEIVPYRITSDAGWGCMLRSAQMLLAQTLRMHFKSRDWRPPRSIAERRRDPFLRSVLTWLADFPSSTECVYSLHNMVAAGLAKYETLPGEWYGPGTASYVIRDLVAVHENHTLTRKTKLVKSLFRVHVAEQGSVYKSSIKDLMTRQGRARAEKQWRESPKTERQVPLHPLDPCADADQPDDVLEWDTGLLLLIPLRLGLKNINETYAESLAHVFSFPQSVGSLGGRPRGARWFYGATANGNSLFGLDPHTVQNAPRRRTARVNGIARSVVDMSEDYIRSVHTTSPEVLSLLKMDPSVTLGFYCRNANDFEDLCQSMAQWRTSRPKVPDLFTVTENAPDYSAKMSSAMKGMVLDDALNMGSSLLDRDASELSDDDDYVML